MSIHPDASIVEMDTVEGIKGGKVFLTLLFRNYNFMLIFLMESKTPYEAVQTLISIDIINKLNIKFINPNQVDLSPNLLKRDFNKNDRQ